MPDKVRYLKLTDLIAQLLAVAVPWAYFIITRLPMEEFHLEHFIMTCFIVGGTQLASVVLNKWLCPPACRVSQRGWYEMILLVLIAMVLIAVVMKAPLLAIILLCYIGPLLIAWYLGITVAELIKAWKGSSS